MTAHSSREADQCRASALEGEISMERWAGNPELAGIELCPACSSRLQFSGGFLIAGLNHVIRTPGSQRRVMKMSCSVIVVVAVLVILFAVGENCRQQPLSIAATADWSFLVASRTDRGIAVAAPAYNAAETSLGHANGRGFSRPATGLTLAPSRGVVVKLR